MEAIVATVISVIAILGLAHSFGVGRGFIERYAVGRAALSAAQGRMEALSVLPPSSDSLRTNGFFVQPFNYRGVQAGTVEWRIEPYDDPAVSGPYNLDKVTVVARWGPPGEQDSLRLSRLFQP